MSEEPNENGPPVEEERAGDDALLRSAMDTSKAYESVSLEYVIDGLKIAAEGAATAFVLTQRVEFLRLTVTLDKMRAHIAKSAGHDRPSDTLATEMPEGRFLTSRLSAYLKIKDGMKKGCEAARQLGACHQGREDLVKIGWGLHDLSNRVSQLIFSMAGDLSVAFH